MKKPRIGRRQGWTERGTFEADLFPSFGPHTAWFSNPNDSSFRNFLTTLSFQQHLRSLRSNSGHPPAKDSHVLTFSNRVSISFRTPQYKLQSYALFSIVTMAQVHPTTKLHRARHNKVDCAKGQEEGCMSDGCNSSAWTAVYIGAFGRWWAWNEGEEGRLATRDRLNAGVLSMEALDRFKGTAHASSSRPPCWIHIIVSVRLPASFLAATATDDTNDSEDSTSLPGDLKPPGPRKTRPVKATFRAGQRRASPTTKTFSGKIKPPLLNNNNNSNNAAGQQSNESAKPLLDKTLSSTPPHQLSTELKAGNSSASDADNAVMREFAKEEQLLQGTVNALKAQIAELQSSSETTQHQLQDELDGCRARKRDEEHTKTDLKAKARTLEEVKRQAEVEYSDAERRHATAKVNKQQLADKIERMKAELSRLDRRETDFSTRHAKSQDHRREREAELLPQLQVKKARVAEQEAAVAALATRVESLESEIDSHKEDIAHFRERSLQRAQSQRSFVPTQIVPVLPAPGEAVASTQPAGQWANYRGNSTNPAYVNGALTGNNGPVSPVSPNSPSPSLFERRRFTHQMDMDPAQQHQYQQSDLSRASSRTTSLRQPSAESLSDRYSGFAPFGPPNQHMTDLRHEESQDASARNNLSLPFFVGGGLTSLDGASSPPVTTPHDGPQSPMTPHQNSLLPAHLFDLLDNDDDDPVPQTPMEVALPPRHNIWSDDAAQAAFNRAGGSPFRNSAEELTLSRTRSSDQARPGSSVFTSGHGENHGLAGNDFLARHSLSLNPGAKAFSPDSNGSSRTPPPQPATPDEAAVAPRRGLFASGLRDVWNRASNKTDTRSAAATAALFDADDIFSPGSSLNADEHS